MYRSMAELATHCRRVRPQWVTVTVALLRNGLTNRSLHIAGRGRSQSFDGFIAGWI